MTIDVIDKPVNLVACPFCKTVWSKLRQCNYTDNNNDATNYVCCVCAESVTNIEAIMKFMRFNMDDYEVDKYLCSQYQNVNKKYVNPKSYKAIIKKHVPIIEIDVSPVDPRLRVTNLGKSGESIVFDNIFQVLSYLKRLVSEQANAVVIKDGWV